MFISTQIADFVLSHSHLFLNHSVKYFHIFPDETLRNQATFGNQGLSRTTGPVKFHFNQEISNNNINTHSSSVPQKRNLEQGTLFSAFGHKGPNPGHKGHNPGHKAHDPVPSTSDPTGEDISNNKFNDTIIEDDEVDEEDLVDVSDIAYLEGFDKVAGRMYIYPTNYPVRQYQFNVVRESLYKNTLVVLPTGLGKTFIAAVVMYNFYRWYPQGKVIFMAPTKPLVAQQIEACYNIMGIPQNDTAEMTGRVSKKSIIYICILMRRLFS